MKSHLFKKTISTALFFFSFTSAAYATAHSKPNSFDHAALEFSEHCRPQCEHPFRVEQQNLNDENFSESLKQTLSKIAEDQSQIWGDTILEGDYFADGPTYLQSVEALYKEGTFIGYRIFYYSKAWETLDCTFNGNTHEGLESCKPGIIREASFVSPDFQSAVTDDGNFATFIPAQK